MKEIKLRPHHLLCLQKFVGEGYDGAFTKNLANIVGHLSANPETKVTLIEGCDDVCMNCPNKVEDACTDGEKIFVLDSGVLDTCRLKYGDEGTWKALCSLAKEKVFETENFNKLCASCQWFYICKNKAD